MHFDEVFEVSVFAQQAFQHFQHIVALRGDIPSGMREIGEFRYANELVAYIRATTGDHFTRSLVF